MPLEVRLGECIDKGMVAPGNMGGLPGRLPVKLVLFTGEAHRKPLEIRVNVLTIPPKVLRHNHTLGTRVLQEEAPCLT
jgi:hypothetical protein